VNLRRRITLLLSGALLFPTALPATAADQPRLEFSGGRWWDGEKFVLKNFYSVNGILTSAHPAHVDSVLDLTGKFVVPPYADAHVHNLNEDGSIAEDRGVDLADGVFLSDGYEASFLALDSNPVDRLESMKRISFRFKQGSQIQVPPGVSDTK
jgi:dihydroorotase-like cyclic amidohydrolase